MKLLNDMIGEDILASIPSIHPTDLQVVKLHGVEQGGLWLESENLTQTMLRSLKMAASSRTPIFFVPYHEIRVLIQGTDKVSLSEEAFHG